MTALSNADKDDLRKYAKLKNEAKIVEKEIEELKPRVLDILVGINAQDNPVGVEGGKLTLRPFRRWTYTPDLEKRMADIKAEQKFQEATGKATYSETFTVYFK